MRFSTSTEYNLFALHTCTGVIIQKTKNTISHVIKSEGEWYIPTLCSSIAKKGEPFQQVQNIHSCRFKVTISSQSLQTVWLPQI